MVMSHEEFAKESYVVMHHVDCLHALTFLYFVPKPYAHVGYVCALARACISLYVRICALLGIFHQLGGIYVVFN